MSFLRLLLICFGVLIVSALTVCTACSEEATTAPDGDLDAEVETDMFIDGDDEPETPVDGDDWSEAEREAEADVWTGQTDYVRDAKPVSALADDPFSQWRISRFLFFGTSDCLDDIRAIAATRDDKGDGLVVTAAGVCAWSMLGQDGSPSGQVHTQRIYAGYEDETAFVDAVWTGKVLVAATENLLHVYDPQAGQWTRANPSGDRRIQTLVYSEILETDTVYVGTQQGVLIYHPSFGFGARLIASDRDVRALAVTQDGLYVGTTTGLLRVSDAGDRVWQEPDGLPAAQINALAVESGETPRLWIGTSAGLVTLTGQDIQPLDADWLPLPYPDIRALAYSPEWGGVFIAARSYDQTAGGVFVREATEWRVFGAPRYVWSADITDLLADDAGLWVSGSAGLTRLWRDNLDLKTKADRALDRVATHHRDGGTVRDLQIESRMPGDYNATRMAPDASDTLKTALFAAARCGEFNQDNSSGHMDQARQALDALLALETATGTSGYPAGRVSAPLAGVTTEQNGWQESEDGQWWQDSFGLLELSGIAFLSVFWKQACDNDVDTPRLHELVVRMADNALSKGHRLASDTNTARPDTHGLDFSPEYLSGEGATDAPGLRALAALTLYSQAYQISGEPRFDEARIALARDHGYLTLLANQARGGIGRMLDERGDATALFFAYAWAATERADVWREQVDAVLAGQADLKDPERLPLAILFKAAVLGAPMDGEGLMAALRDWQPDTAGFSMRADLRDDLRRYTPPGYNGDPDFYLRTDGLSLPSSERPLDKAFTRNAYELFGGEDKMAHANVMWPFYYWFGRVYGIIKAPSDSAR